MPKLSEYMFLYQNEQPVLAISVRTNLTRFRKDIAENSLKIKEFLEAQGKYTADVPFVVYNNSDLDDMDVDICFPTRKPIMGTGDIRYATIPAGKIMTCVLLGDHYERKRIYDTMLAWLAENGYQYDDRTCEYFYLKEGDKEDGELLTKVTMAIK